MPTAIIQDLRKMLQRITIDKRDAPRIGRFEYDLYAEPPQVNNHLYEDFLKNINEVMVDKVITRIETTYLPESNRSVMNVYGADNDAHHAVYSRDYYFEPVFCSAMWNTSDSEDEPEIEDERGGALDEFLDGFKPQETTSKKEVMNKDEC